MGFEVVDASSIQKVKKGVLPAFSQGGRYIDIWPDPDQKGMNRYVADPTEVSLVDRGALPQALIETMKNRTVEFRKADGSVALVKFPDVPSANDAPLEASPTKPGLAGFTDADAEKLAKAVVAAVSKEKAAAEAPPKAPVKPAPWQQRVAAKMKAEKIDPKALIAAVDSMGKSLWDVHDLTDVIGTIHFIVQCLRCERDYEGDDSTIPDDLHEVLTQLVQIYLALAEEETSELLAASSGKQGEKAMDPKDLEKMNSLEKLLNGLTELLAKGKKGLAGHFTKAAAHHEKMAGHHENLATVHKDCAEGGGDKVHKALGSHHEKIAKAHAAHAEHMHKMAAEHGDESEKAASVELEKKKAAAAAEKGEPTSLEQNLQGKITAMVEEASEAGIKKLLESPDFIAKIQEAALARVTEALGKQADPAPSKVTLFPRAGHSAGQAAETISKMNGTTGSDPMADTGL